MLFSPFKFVFFSSAFVAEPGDFPSSPGLIPVSSVRGKVFFVIDDSSQINTTYIHCLVIFPHKNSIRNYPNSLPHHVVLVD